VGTPPSGKVAPPRAGVLHFPNRGRVAQMGSWASGCSNDQLCPGGEVVNFRKTFQETNRRIRRVDEKGVRKRFRQKGKEEPSRKTQKNVGKRRSRKKEYSGRGRRRLRQKSREEDSLKRVREQTREETR